MDVTEEDQEVVGGDARYGRQLKGGTYDATVLEAKEGYTNANKPKTTLVLLIEGTPDAAPEGPVKVDYHCSAGSFSLRNMIEVFEPSKLGKKASLDTASYVGCKVKATTKWEPARDNGSGGSYAAKAAIVKLIGPVTKAAPKPKNVNEDDIPF